MALLALALLICNAAALAGDAYVCPASAPPPDSALCADHSVLAVINHAGDKIELLKFLRAKIGNAPVLPEHGRLASKRGSSLSELSTNVTVLRSFPNLFVLRFKSGLATPQRLTSLARDLCSALKQWNPRSFRGCSDSTTTVRLEAGLKVQSYGDWPNDPLFANHDPYQWALSDAKGIKALGAWQRVGTVPGLDAIKVAVLDTGVAGDDDATTNDRELDATEFVDGADFTVDPVKLGNPADLDGHGTKVASVLGARTNNGQGMAGVAFSGAGQRSLVTLMPVKIMTEANLHAQAQCTYHLLNALPYAVDPTDAADAGRTTDDSIWNLLQAPAAGRGPYNPARGAKVINLSSGFTGCSTDVGETLRRIEHYFPDVVVVAAVPNVGQGDAAANIDSSPADLDYPSRYPSNDLMNNLITVTATDDSRCLRGKYGLTSVDIAAPGIGVIVHGLPSDISATDVGTSFAAPHVSGAVALLKALAPTDWHHAELKRYLMDSNDHSMCAVTAAEDACTGRAAAPRICTDIASGLLDLDAATGPPVSNIVALSSGGEPAAAWTAARPATVSWQHTFKSLLCTQVDIDLVVDQTSGGTNTVAAKLSASPVDVLALTATFDAATLGAAASAALPSGSEAATARVRLQCVGSHMFRTSQDFTLKRAQ